ncbi:MAG TPA: enoyl-CoA hydratase-related protein [Steroidobacteraceae bacterium]|nr:enoyl-CoA hydratase-related protein [Steroidobacteraceae bacterium]
MNFQTLQVDRPEESILRLTLHRPDAANALNTQMARELIALLAPLRGEPDPARCLILSGAGERAFCAGADLKERDGMSDAQWRAQHLVFEEAFRALEECPIPVIAAVNGAAFGGGCELALACDFIYATASARFAQPETHLGIIPGCGGTQRLARAVGAARAKQIILSATPFDAPQALAWGLVNEVVADGSLGASVLAVARTIGANAPLAVRQAKRVIDCGLGVDLRSALALELAAYNQLVPTEDRREGVRAAREKRTPRFSGR